MEEPAEGSQAGEGSGGCCCVRPNACTIWIGKACPSVSTAKNRKIFNNLLVIVRRHMSISLGSAITLLVSQKITAANESFQAEGCTGGARFITRHAAYPKLDSERPNMNVPFGVLVVLAF